MKNIRGVSLVELLIVLSIFGIVMAGLYSAYSVQLKQGVKEFRFAESEMEYQIAKSIIERDLQHAGFGLTFPFKYQDYCGEGIEATIVAATACPSKLDCPTSLGFCVPIAVWGTDDNPDTLSISGTAIGHASRASQAWSYIKNESGYLQEWSDARESLLEGNSDDEGDRFFYINPIYGTYVTGDTPNETTGKTWLFPYSGPTTTYGTTNPPAPNKAKTGDVVYGLYSRSTPSEPTADYPYYVVRYYLSSSASGLKNCEGGTKNLLRAESKSGSLVPAQGDPILNCVLDFEVAIGRDVTKDGIVDCWDNGGADFTANNTDLKDAIKNQVKQVRIYALVQDGNFDPSFTYSNPDPAASAPDRILVGDNILMKCQNNAATAGLVGREITLTANQRHYQWKVITVSVIPRNIR